MDRIEYEQALQSLTTAKESQPELATMIDLQYDLLKTISTASLPQVEAGLTADEVDQHVRQGIPLLRGRAPQMKWEALFELFTQVCRIIAQHRPELAPHFDQFLYMLDHQPAKLTELFATYIENGEVALNATATELGFSASEEQSELLAFVFNQAAHPFLSAYAKTAFPLVNEQLWQQGYCPICGGEPDLACLERSTRKRRLVCQRCDIAWLYPRIRCPFCNTSQPSDLAYFPVEDGKYRLYVCHKCKRYLKAVDLERAGRGVLFPVERILTVPLDLAAKMEGYS
jgi:FdhE protein